MYEKIRGIIYSFKTSIKSRIVDVDSPTDWPARSLLEPAMPFVWTSAESSRFRFAECVEGEAGSSVVELKPPEAMTRLAFACDVV